MTRASSSLEAGSWEFSVPSSSSWIQAGAEHSPDGRDTRGQGGRSPNNIGLGANKMQDILSLHESLCQTTAAYNRTGAGAPSLNLRGGKTTTLTARSVPTNDRTVSQQVMRHWTTPTQRDDAIPQGRCKTNCYPAKKSTPR